MCWASRFVINEYFGICYNFFKNNMYRFIFLRGRYGKFMLISFGFVRFWLFIMAIVVYFEFFSFLVRGYRNCSLFFVVYVVIDMEVLFNCMVFINI